MTSRPTRLGPGGRPLAGLRIPALLGALAAFAVTGVVMLSDRAPGLFRRLSSKVDAGVSRATGAVGHPTGPDARIPQSDFPVHVAMWAVAALLVGLAAWSWLSLLLGAAGVLSLSVGLELAQRLFSSSRSVQVADLAANAVGVAAGVGTVAAWTLLRRLLASGRAGAVHRLR